ncbi:hypothetical protein DSM112329_04601 [Paraconexibacter sp. AEG42_29]|uniref:DUF4328 domain-containing protein n=1 Tax=Paraconexibacter sp. AEG42_29 TaxID=2997339 RepID=A0AAU7B1I4_9ACTN
MNSRIQMWCAWCGPAFVAVFFTGFIVAGMIPPPSPGWNAERVAAFYQEDTDSLRAGLVVMMISAGLTAPLVALISVQLRRIAGPDSPLPTLQLIGGTAGVLAILVPMWMFLAAAFEPTRDPQITEALNDLAFLPFIGNFPPACVQLAAIGVAILADQREKPILPRWVGYYNLWTAFLFLPGLLVVYFKDGAFAWNGAVVFWVVAVLFGNWFIVMSHVLRRAIREQRAEEESAAAGATAPPPTSADREAVPA